MKERRRFVRFPAEGEVLLFAEPSKTPVVRGRLLDFSQGGFRFVHDCRSLSAGQEFAYSHPRGRGHARVVWVRIAGTVVESGLALL